MNLHPSENSKTVGYLKVSTGKQDLKNQKLELHEYARRNNFTIDEFIEIGISPPKSTHKRQIDELMTYLREGDLLLVDELSKLGRTAGQIIQIIDALIKEKVRFAAVKEFITLNGKQDVQTKTMISMFALFAKIETELISERTKHALRRAKEKGMQLGRPKGRIAIMSESNEAVTKKYGIQVEESSTYIYNEFRYGNLADATNYAKLKEGQLKVISAVPSKTLKRGDSNVIAER